ncbi:MULTISPECIES: FlgO family outer membrane protein [Shewanella]|uniref:FlgO family outer membrane protein n=1 Tax=Shewanella metallivivens TaxID=2872342 RepID=A0ABT5TJ75_9GAMM|nr:FlgO family outer membrane protein [Shewanella metallivivens]MDD8058656.1 FlgO family outer membrane protein [Shewanella metallivivens]
MINRFTLTAVLAILTVAACNQTPNPANNLAFENNGKYTKVADENGVYQNQLIYDIQGAGLAPKGQINVWAEKLVNELVLQNDALRSDQPLLITTPVLSNNLNATNELALQLQQGMLAAFHAREFNLVDMNVAINLRATEQGEFMLSRNWELLPSGLPVSHVLVSTMSMTPEGVVFNGRVVNVTNNRVLSAVQSFVAASSLSGYLQPSELIESRNGLLYRHEKKGDSRYTVLGDEL